MERLDMRPYAATIKAAVARERELDPNWGWHVKRIGKGKAVIGWGYLDYIGEKNGFEVSIETWPEYDDNDPYVKGDMPNGVREIAFIGPKHWHDAATIEDGIRKVIHRMALSAHNTY